MRDNLFLRANIKLPHTNLEEIKFLRTTTFCTEIFRRNRLQNL